MTAYLLFMFISAAYQLLYLIYSVRSGRKLAAAGASLGFAASAAGVILLARAIF